MRDLPSHHPEATQGWQASLALAFGRDGDCTRLQHNRHSGPLRVQKALYPEGAAVCHAILVHPPGGIKAGDRLAIDVAVGAGAHALLTAPGAAKWYRGDDGRAYQDITLAAAADGVIEWLPQETIYFDGARPVQRQTVRLAAGARYIGMEVMCLGRRASGERFARGELRLHNEIWQDGQLLWFEQARIGAGSSATGGIFGLDGRTVCATLTAVGVAPPELIAAVRALDPALGASQVKSVFIARLLCDDSEHARRVMVQAWQLLRPILLGLPAIPPRIWAT